MATRMDTINKRTNYKRILPGSSGKLKMKINLTQNFTTMVTGHGKNKGIFTPIQNNRSTDMPLWHQRPDYRSLTIRM